MSIVINDTENNFNIYIFLLFEALFLIFIVYFILKKKDVYSKDDEIKYDWYFYLRISIITLAFFNFFLYIYNITKDSSKNSRKNGGGGAFSSFKSNKVVPVEENLDYTLLNLNEELNKLRINLFNTTKKQIEMANDVLSETNNLKNTDKQKEEIKNLINNKIEYNKILIEEIVKLTERIKYVTERIKYVTKRKRLMQSTKASTRASTRASSTRK